MMTRQMNSRTTFRYFLYIALMGIMTSITNGVYQDQYIGCFNGNPTICFTKDFPNGATSNIQKCIEHCRANTSLTYAVLKNGTLCSCGDEYGVQVSDDNCNLTCIPEGRKACSGVMRYPNAYALFSVCPIGTYGSSCDSGCHCKREVQCTRMTGACPNGCHGNWTGDKCNSAKLSQQYIGCFADNGFDNRAMDCAQCPIEKVSNSIELCTQMCSQRGNRTFAGAQFSHQCFCGDAYDKFGPLNETRCHMSCASNADEKCGGVWANSVYSVCPAGHYGKLCAGRCHCMNDNRCVYSNGSCLPIGTRCKFGWKGKSCNIRDCGQNNGNCFSNETCYSIILNSTTITACRCSEGFQRNKIMNNCTDIDECSLSPAPCDLESSTCVNTIGHFQCNCKEGYRPTSNDSTSCNDIDECTNSLAHCDPASTSCNNTIGGYECICNQGFVQKGNEKFVCQGVGFSIGDMVSVGIGSAAGMAALIGIISIVVWLYRKKKHHREQPGRFCGAFFDAVKFNDIKTAFKYEVDNQEKKQQRVKLSADYDQVDMEDSYVVGSKLCQKMYGGIFAFFAAHTMATIDTIKSYSATFRMPFVTPNIAMNTSGQELGYELYVRPYYARAVADMIGQYGWRDVWYLYDSDEGLERLQQLLDALTDRGYIVKMHVYRVRNADDAFGTLQRLDSRREESKRILLDLPTRDCESLLQRENKETRGMRHHYFIVGLGIHEISLGAFSNGGMNITGLRLVDTNNSTVRSFLSEWNKMDPNFYQGTGSKISYEAALTVDAFNVISRALHKMVNEKQNSFKQILRVGKEGLSCDAEPVQTFTYGYDIMKAMREIEFGGLTGDVRFDKFGLRRDYKLDVLEVSLSRGLAKIGSWHSETGIQIQQAAMVRERNSKGENEIANKTRIVTSILVDPYLMRKEQPANGPPLEGNDMYEGYCADLAKKIADFLKCDYIISPVKDDKYGQKDEKNSSWNGMVGELVRHEADLAIAPLTITAEREQVIDFSKPFMSLGISIMIKKPTKDIPSVFSFMNPLSYEIWMCVIFAYIGVSVVLFLVSRFSPFEWHIEDHTDGPSVTNNFTIFNSLWFSLGAFMQQGCDIEPRSISGRIVGSVWWFFTLIIISSYTANLAAFLTVERMQSPIESAEDLAKQTEIKYGMVSSGSTLEFFKRSTIPVYERMWAFMQTAEPSVLVAKTEDGIDRVRKGKYAFLIESTTNDYNNQKPPCDTMKVGSNLDSKGYGIGTPLGSDIRDHITLAVLELSEHEELQKLEKLWWYEKNEKNSCGEDSRTLKKQEATSSLKLQNVAGIFYILIGGLSLALVMATCEFLYKSKVEARRRKTTFTNAVRSKARLSITGMPERQTTSYTYAPTAQIISLDGYAEANTHTQV